LEKENKKDQLSLEKSKLDLIKEIKKNKKEDLIPKKEIIKLSLWKRIKMVLMG
jgi:transposase